MVVLPILGNLHLVQLLNGQSIVSVRQRVSFQEDLRVRQQQGLAGLAVFCSKSREFFIEFK